MTYASGQTVVATDYMEFRGSRGPGTAYDTGVSATAKVAALIGVGYGDRGYGQTSTSLPQVTIGQTISAAEWNALFAAMGTMNLHQASGLTIPLVSSGGIITALDGSSGRANLQSLINFIDTNRITASLARMSLTSALTSTRTTQWSDSITHEWTATFSSEDEARYFFNTGGRLHVSASRTGGAATLINAIMTTLLNEMGTIRVGANSTTYTGTGGTPSSIGYYTLTDSYQDLFTHVGSGAYGYGNLTFTLRARSENRLGTNGGNGNLLRFQCVMATNLPPSPYHVLDGTAISSISQLKVSTGLTVASPLYSTVTPL